MQFKLQLGYPGKEFRNNFFHLNPASNSKMALALIIVYFTLITGPLYYGQRSSNAALIN